MTRRDRQRKHAQRVAHANGEDNRRPAGSEKADAIRNHRRDERRAARKAAA